MRVSIGQRRHLVRLDQRVETADAHGGQVATYTKLADVWAAILPLSTREVIMAGQMTAALSTEVWIPYRTDLSIKDRIVFGSRTLQAEAVDDLDGKRHLLRLLCSEVAA